MRQLITFSLLFALVLSANVAFAQPANDDCANATALTIAASEAACSPTAATTIGATQSSAGLVCSGSWFADDVWFSFTTGATVPAHGVGIKLAGAGATPIPTFGMSVYTDCGTSATPFQCFSNGDGTQFDIQTFVDPNTTYYIRVWSGGSPTANAGTFEICVYERAPSTALVIWEDDFSDSTLSNWTLSGTPAGANFEWMKPGNAGRGAYAAALTLIGSLSNNNGAVVYDSDFYDNGGTQGAFGSGLYPSPQVGEMTSGLIDCSAAQTVLLEFTQAYRNFQSTTTVSYSTDGGTTFNDIVINGAVATNASTPNNDLQQILLPGAGGSSNVVIKFRFDADYYYWMIDDVRLLSVPAVNDLSVSSSFYTPANYGTPVTQMPIDTFGFSMTFNNEGSTDLSGVTAYAIVGTAAGVPLFVDSVVLGTIPSGTTDSFVVFPNNFVPNLPVGTYQLAYAIFSDSADFSPADNQDVRLFEVTDSTFRKDAQVTGGVRPGGGPLDYLFGAQYRMAPNANDTWKATTAHFTCGMNAADGVLEGKMVTLYLLELADTIASDLSNFDVTEPFSTNSGLSTVGFATYTFPQGAVNYDIFSVELLDFNTFTAGVDLKADHSYFLMVEYAGASNPIFAGIETVPGQPNAILYSSQWFTGGFADRAPVVRMDIRLNSTSTNNVELTNATMEVFPNPATSFINIDVTFEEATEATVVITDVTGRLVRSEELGKVAQDRLTIDVSDLPAGTYVARLSTKDGIKTQRFVVAK